MRARFSNACKGEREELISEKYTVDIREKIEMNRIVLTIAFILFLTGSFGLISHTQQTQIEDDPTIILDSRPTEQEIDTLTGANQDRPAETGNVDMTYDENDGNAAGSDEDISQKESETDDASRSQIDTSPETEPSPYTNPPDGRVYYGPNPPYAYVPTYNPKEEMNITLIPNTILGTPVCNPAN